MLETFAAGPPYDERASSLTDLVRELFPDFDPDASLVPVDPTPPSIVVSGPNAVGGTVSSPRSGSRRLALTLGVSLVLSSAVLVAFMLHRRPATEESAAAPVAAAPEPTAADPVPASPPSASPALVDSRALKAVDAEAEREPEPEPEPDEPPPVRPLPAPPQRPRPPRNEREARKERPERRPDASAPTAAAPTPVDAASITPPAPPPPRPEPPPPSVSPAERRPAASPPPTAAPAPAGPRRSVSVPTPLRLPATYSVRSAPELDKMLRMIEREAVTTGKVPAAVVQGVTRSFGERTRAALAGGATVEIQPKQLYTIIVRAALQGLGRGAIASELRATAP